MSSADVTVTHVRAYTVRVSWWQYVQRVTNDAPGSQIARKIGEKTAVSTVNRWRDGVPPKVETVIAFADAYGQPRREALIAAYLDSEEALRNVSDRELLVQARGLLEELEKRMR